MATSTGKYNTRGSTRNRSNKKNDTAEKHEIAETTDSTRWRLRDDDSRHTWHYLDESEAKKWPQSYAEKYFLNLPTVRIWWLH